MCFVTRAARAGIWNLTGCTLALELQSRYFMNDTTKAKRGAVVVSTWVKVNGSNECVSVRARPGECSEALSNEIAKLHPSVCAAELDRAVASRFITG